jgi:hypothetical protein
MSWGCKPENYPDGCGWSNRITYPTLGMVEWWCESCERGETRAIPPEPPADQFNRERQP